MAELGLKVDKLSSGILNNVSLFLGRGEIGVVLGSNGAGKTTLLNAISGLREIKSGKIFLHGRDITNIAPEKRNISYIFQSLALFPHFTVFENVAFPLKVKGDKNINEKVNKILSKLDISNLKDRFPLKISGGEKQRVAIARALITNPDLLLMDEPFSSLDFEMRKFIRQEFVQIIKSFSITTLFVTHDPYEAEEVGDKIFHILKGKIAEGKEKEKNILEVISIKQISGSMAIAGFGGFTLVAPLPEKKSKHYKAEFAAEDIYISSRKPPVPTLNTVNARVISHKSEDGRVIIFLDVQGKRVVANVPAYMWNEVKGEEVCIIIKYRGVKIKEA